MDKHTAQAGWANTLRRYPLDQLRPCEYEPASGEYYGDCFFISFDDMSMKEIKALLARARSRLWPARFIYRQMDDEDRGEGVRVWRMPQPN